MTMSLQENLFGYIPLPFLSNSNFQYVMVKIFLREKIDGRGEDLYNWIDLKFKDLNPLLLP